MANTANLPELVLVRDLQGYAQTRRQHARAAAAGVEVRVARGAYASRTEWDALDEIGRARLTLVAHHRTRVRPPLFSHGSAAVLHGLPLLDGIGDAIHVSVGQTSGGRSAPGVVAHSTSTPEADIVEIEGMQCTSLERTVVDLAASSGTAAAVAAADCALRRGASRHGVLATWLRAQPMRGHRRALEIIEFADARAESPLESVSRVSMRAAGVPRPELQTPFRDRGGVIGYVDFAWPDLKVVGEADGDAKYLDAAFRGGRTAERVVLDEKIREDRLRALGLRVVRWRWGTASDPRALAARLADAGVG